MAILSRTGAPTTTASTSEEVYYSGGWAPRASYRQIDGTYLGYGFPGLIVRLRRRPLSQRIHIVETDKAWISEFAPNSPAFAQRGWAPSDSFPPARTWCFSNRAMSRLK